MSIRRSIRVVIPLAVLSVVLMVASVAWACTKLRSQTTFGASNGTSGTVLHGGTVTNVKADNFPALGAGEPANNTSWNLVASQDANYCMTYRSPNLYTGATFNRSNSPDLGPVSGTAPSTLGDYDLCFVYSDYSTRPAVLTVN